MRLLATIGILLTLGAPAASARATAVGNADVAALQVALRAARTYSGPVDGQSGPATTDALIAFQQQAGLTPDGIAGPRTRRALGRRGRPNLGTRPLVLGDVGWDVAALQFRLAWHGFPSGPFDGAFGARLAAAVLRFQRFAHLPTIGVAGPRTMAALHKPLLASPIRLRAPLVAPVGDGFGPRGDAFHAGLDFIADAGAAVAAAGSGEVTWAGPRGSFGNAVVIAHRDNVRTLYAHLSRIDVVVGQRVGAGATIGLVGSTGRSTGPHLHFEVHVGAACVDPRSALG